MKKLFKGTFNVSGENIVLHTHSKSPDTAFRNFIGQLILRLGVGRWTVLAMFDGSKDNYRVTEVITNHNKGARIN